MYQRKSKSKGILLEKSQAQIYMEENFPNLIGKLNSQFRSEMKDSSAQSTSDESHVLYYQAFLNHFMEIAPHVYVSTSDWALAFIQQDLASITRQLCKVIQSEDLEFQRQLIQKTAIWMNAKYLGTLDPWEWSCSEQFQEMVPIPTAEEIFIINHEIDAFNQTTYRTDAVDNFPLYQEIFDDINASLSLDQLDSSLGQLTGHSDTYTQVFQKYVKFISTQGSKMNPAQVASALTRCTIPFNTDIFFDAVQFSNNRVTDAGAAAMKGFKEVAKKISKQYIRRDFLQANKQFRSVEDVCPVKRLAIYRAAKFLVSVRKGEIIAKTLDFNSENGEHNVYPTPFERLQIDEGIEEVASSIFTEARKRLGDEVVDNFSQPGQYPPTSTSSCNELQVLMGDSGLCKDTANNSNFDVLLQQSPMPSREVSTWLKDLTSYSDVSEEFSFPTTSTQTHASTTLADLHNLNELLLNEQDSVLPIHGTYKPDGTNGIIYKNYQVPKLQTSSTYGNDLNVTNSNGSESSFFASSPGTAQQNITVGEHTYPLSVWNQAQRDFQKSGCVKAGKYLFHELFTDTEKKTCTWSGRQETPKFPQNISNSILDALKYFEENSGKPERTPESYIITKVFVETGNQIRNPKKCTTTSK